MMMHLPYLVECEQRRLWEAADRLAPLERDLQLARRKPVAPQHRSWVACITAALLGAGRRLRALGRPMLPPPGDAGRSPYA